MCVCVCVCVCVYGAIAQLVRELSYGEYIRDLKGSQVQVTVMTSYGIISLSKKLTHICFSQLRSINEYLVMTGVLSGHWL